jgi:hypothetical protein
MREGGDRSSCAVYQKIITSTREYSDNTITPQGSIDLSYGNSPVKQYRENGWFHFNGNMRSESEAA